jgi:Acylamino-acid-releasing enzyme, N-terminal domain
VLLLCSLLENLPDSVSPGQAIWCPDDLGVVCVGYNHEPYRLGLIYCDMRASCIYHIDLKSYTCTVLGPSDRSVRSPVFSPDKTKLVYLENEVGGPHRHCSRLLMCDWYVIVCLFCFSPYLIVVEPQLLDGTILILDSPICFALIYIKVNQPNFFGGARLCRIRLRILCFLDIHFCLHCSPN